MPKFARPGLPVKRKIGEKDNIITPPLKDTAPQAEKKPQEKKK